MKYVDTPSAWQALAAEIVKQWPQHTEQRLPFERTVGGALGSCQARVYQALAEADIHPNWVVGISIGAVDATLYLVKD